MFFSEGLKEFKAGRYQKAAEFFSMVTFKDYKNHKAWNALGVCYSSLGKYDEADRCFQNAIAIFPESGVYHKNRLKNKQKIPDHSFGWEERSEFFTLPENEDSNFHK